jgi:hypothetical protein
MATVPLPARLPLFAGVFAIFSTLGFFIDLIGLRDQTPWLSVIFFAVGSGLVSVGYFAGVMYGIRGIIAAVAGQVALMLVISWISSDAPLPPPTTDWVVNRARADAIGILAGIIGAYWAFIGFIARQGVGQVRLQTEMDLARDIHTALVPPVALRSGRIEAFGGSVPSTEVGGDLVDVIAAPGGLLAVVADVSGHGVAAGTLMATVRAAVRARLAGTDDTSALGDLLTTVNQVLTDIGRPDRFATLAALRLPEHGDAEVALAGHLPVLRVRGGAIEHIENQHVPLGVRAGETFSASSVTTAPGDLFVLFTDGVIEVDDGSGNQLGLEALEAEILAHADQALPVLHDRILARVHRHGRANDDVTLLLVKLT